MKTYTPKLRELTPTWYLVDAEDMVLGRLATKIAMVLRGKHRPTFSAAALTGDAIVVINASKIRVTGKKAEKKLYITHSRYPGSLKTQTYAEVFAKKPEEVLLQAVKGMLPPNRLRKILMQRLKVYPGPEHDNQAQKPQPLKY